MSWLASRPLRMTIQLLLLGALVAVAAGTRRHVLNAQRQVTRDGTIPFTLESALAFRRIQMVYRDGDLPRVDRGIQYPEGVLTRETDTLGPERIYARAAQWWPGTLRLDEKVRWLQLGWFCLTIPGMYFWVRWMGGGGWGGFWAAAFYAVAISAVARSTGQELSHENNALPLLLWHLALDAWARERGGRPLTRVLAGWAAAGLAAWALCWWDLVQFYLGLFMLWGLAEALRGRLMRGDLWQRYVPLMAVLLAASFRNPYLAAHGFGVSPVMLLGWGVLLAGVPIAQRQRWVTRLILVLIPWLGGYLFMERYLPAYNHFSTLLWAKIKCLNIRPADPSLLSFTQRILWAPALNSTSWRLLVEWFPALLVLTGMAIWSFMRRVIRGRIIPVSFSFLLVLVLASLVSFVLFFRFHVWLAMFACGLMGLWVGQLDSRTQPGWQRSAAMVLLAGGWVLEAWQPWLGPLRNVWPPATVSAPDAPQWAGPLFWGRPNVYADETEALMTHLREFVAPEPVLANFGISAAIATYGGCPVVLHPKFEAPDIRMKVQEYGEALFRGDEDGFRSWMEAQGTTVYVHSMGEFATQQPGLQMRYMVNALEPATNAAARLFEQRPEELQHFQVQFANRKFRVFRLLNSTVAARRANQLADQARTALEQGAVKTAATQAAHALRVDAENETAQDVARHASALMAADFRMADDWDDWTDVPAWAPAQPWQEK